jgi:hypothetical protein
MRAGNSVIKGKLAYEASAENPAKYLFIAALLGGLRSNLLRKKPLFWPTAKRSAVDARLSFPRDRQI